MLRVSGAGLLLLRRLTNLRKLRFEQWTNTLSPVSGHVGVTGGMGVDGKAR